MRETKFKQTEIGLIPEDWEIVSLDGVCQPCSIVRGPFGGALKKEMFVSHGYKVYEQRNAIYQDIDRGNYFIDEQKYKSMKRFAVCAKDFIVSCSGTIGRIYQIPANYPAGIINQALLKFRIDNNIVSDKYFYYYFLSDSFQLRVIEDTQGGAMKNLVGMSKFRETLIVIPLMNEQIKVAETLTDIDALITSLDKLIAKKKAIKQGAMQQLLTGKKRLAGFTEPWVEKKLGDILDYEQPTNYLVSNTNYIDKGIPVLTAGKTFILGYTDEKNGVFNKVPVIIFDDFTTDSKYVNFKFKAKSSAMKMLSLINPLRDNLVLVYQLMQNIKYTATDHQRHWIGIYSNISIELPATLQEQAAIAAILSDMDKEIDSLAAKRAKYEKVKAGMMQQLLTGKIRLID